MKGNEMKKTKRNERKKLNLINSKTQVPGIEPGLSVWKTLALPLDDTCLFIRLKMQVPGIKPRLTAWRTVDMSLTHTCLFY